LKLLKLPCKWTNKDFTTTTTTVLIHCNYMEKSGQRNIKISQQKREKSYGFGWGVN